MSTLIYAIGLGVMLGIFDYRCHEGQVSDIVMEDEAIPMLQSNY